MTQPSLKLPTLTAAKALMSPQLFGPYFGPSWRAWFVVLKALFGERLSDAELAIFREVAGGRDPPTAPVREGVFTIGRGGGKDAIAGGFVIPFLAMRFDPKTAGLRPGERAHILCVAVDKDQAAQVFDFCAAMFANIPVLRALLRKIGRKTIELTNRVVINVVTNSYRSIRGRSLLAVVFDEVAYWRSDEISAVPDTEVHLAVKPGLARVKGSMLVMISSAHKRAGLLYERFNDHYGKDDAGVLAIKGTTFQFNPLADKALIEADIAKDPQRYSAEYLSEWRDDLAGFIGRDVLDAAVDVGVTVRPYASGVYYFAFVDSSLGRGDSFTLAISHRDRNMVVLDLSYERKPPFNPEDVVAEICAILREYGIRTVVGDNAGAEWVVAAFRKFGVQYAKHPDARSIVYLNCLPLFTSGRVRLIDEPKIVMQFCSLERRVLITGREEVNHARNAHDDVANAVAGALVLAATAPQPFRVSEALLREARKPGPKTYRRRWPEPMY